MKTFLFALPLVLVGCSSDPATTPATGTDTGTATDTAPTDTGTAGDSTTPTDTGTAPTDTGTTPTDAASDVPYKPSTGATYFCQGFKAACGFGKGFADELTCQKAYDSWGLDSHTCVANELGKKNCDGAACTGAPCSPCK